MTQEIKSNDGNAEEDGARSTHGAQIATEVLRSENDTDRLAALLRDADEDEERIRSMLADPANAAYAVLDDRGTIAGAALMRWNRDESEIIYIAIESGRRGRGLGKAAIAEILAEAKRRGVRAVLVGTSNADLDNVAFYQKCGFRIDSVRPDYFAYLASPVYANGIRIRDMLVLRYELTG
ncbi:MAG TPA: GNAT family N-acetyltransferase [Gammaproteobacteria bacterium]|nr:GNAT family N-acetyltransferase [Gammaproteobacteria bacterium]